MRSLRARLEKVEAARERDRLIRGQIPLQRASDAKQRALSVLWDVLDRHYPAERLCPGAPDHIDEDSVRAAAARLQAGTPSDADRAALAAMPADALRAFGHPAEVFIAMVADLCSGEPTFTGVQARGASQRGRRTS